MRAYNPFALLIASKNQVLNVETKMVSTNACMVVDLFHVRNIKTELLQKKLFELSVQQKLRLQLII